MMQPHPLMVLAGALDWLNGNSPAIQALAAVAIVGLTAVLARYNQQVIALMRRQLDDAEMQRDREQFSDLRDLTALTANFQRRLREVAEEASTGALLNAPDYTEGEMERLVVLARRLPGGASLAALATEQLRVVASVTGKSKRMHEQGNSAFLSSEDRERLRVAIRELRGYLPDLGARALNAEDALLTRLGTKGFALTYSSVRDALPPVAPDQSDPSDERE
jgi:hypothetical protein